MGRAVILAAGVGDRLGEISDKPPKALLEFGGKTLLRRHLDCLAANGIREVAIGVGYKSEMIEAEIARIAPKLHVEFVRNERYREGSVVTLWALRDRLAAGGDTLVMDADVLYDPALIERLVRSRHENVLLLDRDFEPGDEPVKICLKNGRIVDFRKIVAADYDRCGESVGFFRFSQDMARRIAGLTDGYVASGRADQPYEEALRDAMLAAPEAFGCEDITGIPWIEIDFAGDVERARNEVLPRIP